MEKIIPISASELASITQIRKGEIKFGEKMLTLKIETDFKKSLESCDASFVLFGIPEDIGVRANFGRSGTASAFENALKTLVNIQHNKFCKGSEILVIGVIDVLDEMKLAENLDPSNEADLKLLNQLVEKIDKEVAYIVTLIVKAGKIPIIIGGGHNNAYGNIKGTALAKGKSINAINFDAHTDFRSMEGRHSGNGFSYAFEEGFLKKYFIFGIHENYNSKKILKKIKERKEIIKYNTYEEISVRQEKSFKSEMKLAFNFIKNTFYGIEIDLDSIPNIGSSAMTISGFSVEQLRQFVSFFANNNKVSYLHICEAAPTLCEDKNTFLTGKLIAYLITDFIKSSPFKSKTN